MYPKVPKTVQITWERITDASDITFPGERIPQGEHMSKTNARVLIIYLTIFILGSDTSTTENKNTTVLSTFAKIMLGHEARRGQIPYQVFLTMKTKKGILRCGGSIISSGYVLTAAHCVVKIRRPSDITVGASSTIRSWKRPTVKRKVSKVVIYNKYVTVTSGYDIALLKLRRKLPLDDEYLSSITMINNTAPVGLHCIVSGWGNTAWISIPYSSHTLETSNITTRLKQSDIPQGNHRENLELNSI
ncbi:chymotrypsinogen A-like [Periplaneta americana]|uniref:chymotrypsinogen A-like n=1 Tax=Periplaneta americana TaxID=6978 RepID=UPI0037E88F73